MKRIGATWLVAISLVAAPAMVWGQAQTSRNATQPALAPSSARYQELQQRLAVGWNTWDVHSVTTQVLLPEGLAIHVGLKHNTTLWQDAFLGDALIGRLTPDAEQVFPGPHSWDGSYTDLRLSWKGHELRLQTAHDGSNLVMLATPLPSRPLSPLPATIVFSVNYLWDRPGSVAKGTSRIEAHGPGHSVAVYCTCENKAPEDVNLPISGPYFSVDFVQPVGISTGVPLAIEKIQTIIEGASAAYQQSVAKNGKTADVVDAIQTVLGWDTIYEPEGRRVISPVSRVWSVTWGGYVIFDWETFFAATMASVGDRDLAYADAIETLRSETQQGFVPNYARSGDWKSSDRSEPPVGSITVLGIYQRIPRSMVLRRSLRPVAAVESMVGENTAISMAISRGEAMGRMRRRTWTTVHEERARAPFWSRDWTTVPCMTMPSTTRPRTSWNSRTSGS